MPFVKTIYRLTKHLYFFVAIIEWPGGMERHTDAGFESGLITRRFEKRYLWPVQPRAL